MRILVHRTLVLRGGICALKNVLNRLFNRIVFWVAAWFLLHLYDPMW